MSMILKLLLMITILLAIGSVSSSASTREVNKREGDAPDSSKSESDEEDRGTVSPEGIEELKEEIIENQAENAEKYDLPGLTNSPEDIEKYLKEEEKEYGKDLPAVVEEGFTEDGDLKNFVHFVTLFDKIENAGKEGEEEVVEKSPAEMEEMKEEVFKLNNEFHEQHGLPPVSHEDFDKVWDIQKEEYGKRFPGKVEALIGLLKEIEKEETTTVKEVPESVPEGTTEPSEEEEEEEKEEIPQDAFILRNSKEKICIIAKFQSAITIMYSGKGAEQKVEVSVPPSAETKGKCAGPNRSPSLQISWGKFIFALLFNKTSEDTWGVTTIELTYDTSEPLFDGAINRSTVTIPFGYSYFTT